MARPQELERIRSLADRKTSPQEQPVDFGRYKGRTVRYLPQAYLKWGACTLSEPWNILFQRELQRRGIWPEQTEPDWL